VTEKLFTPGPVEIPARVLRALAQRPPHHRSETFRNLFADVSKRLDRLFGTSGRVVVLAASGTGGMEAAVASFVGRDEPTIAAVAGKFGDRWTKILAAYGHRPRVVRAELGAAVDPPSWAAALDAEPAGVAFLTHSETSTGTLFDLRALAQAARARGALVVADVVTSLAVHPLRQDDDAVDVAVAGSQKGLMLPPGLALVGLGPRALERLERGGRTSPAFYLDLKRAADRAADADTPFTPAVSLILALHESMSMIEEIGVEEVWRRHARFAEAIRSGAQSSGFTLFSKSPANSVTALVPPSGVEAGAVVKHLRSRHGMVLAGGQDELKGKIVRVGHMGLAYEPQDAVAVCGALEDAAMTLGATVVAGRAGETARKTLESAA